MKALVAALSGDRKALPSWNGSVESLRSWLRQLSLWELDNNMPKNCWGLKLLQTFAENSAPRRLAETAEMSVLTSEAGYGAILSAIMAKFSPFLEAAGPAAVENFFYGGERAKSESFATYVANKEVSLQELESYLGKKLPPRIAGHAGLSDSQRENMAVKYNALLTFDQAANALRPLDRPDALVSKVSKNFVASMQPEHDEEEEELVAADGVHEGAEEDDLKPESKYTASVLVNISGDKEKKLAVYAGNEAVVDTAAEEAVIGSAAMSKLRECLAGFGGTCTWSDSDLCWHWWKGKK
eukprot:s406_g7.t1